MRVVSLSPAITEILAALGKGNLLVLRDQFSDFPESVRSVPSLRGHTAVEVSDVANAKPDLVCTSTVIQEKLAADLRARNVPVVHFATKTLQGIYESIEHMGVLVQAEEEAKKLIARLKEDLREMGKCTKLLSRKARVYVEEWPNPPMVSGNWVPELITLAGGQSFPIEPGTLSREVLLGEMTRFDPDFIVLSWCGAGERVDRDIVAKRPGWSELRAVRNGSIRVIDDSFLNRPGPRVIEGVRRLYGWCFEALH